MFWVCKTCESSLARSDTYSGSETWLCQCQKRVSKRKWTLWHAKSGRIKFALHGPCNIAPTISSRGFYLSAAYVQLELGESTSMRVRLLIKCGFYTRLNGSFSVVLIKGHASAKRVTSNNFYRRRVVTGVAHLQLSPRGDRLYLRKSADIDCKAQISPLSWTNALLICALRSAGRHVHIRLAKVKFLARSIALENAKFCFYFFEFGHFRLV